MFRKILPNTFLIAIIFCYFHANCYSEFDCSLFDKNQASDVNLARDLKSSRLGRDIYIDAKAGDDNGDGSIISPWKSINRAFDHYAGRPAPGDRVIIKAGVYRERLDIQCRGNAENMILIGPYGDGEVIIDCSDKVESWANYKGNIYKAKCSFQPTAIVLDEKPLFPEFSLARVDKGKWYYDSRNQIVYLYVEDGRNPSLHEVGVVGNDEYRNGIFLNNAQYVTVYGVTIKYADGYAISILGDYNKIIKCNIKFNGKGAVSIWPYADTKATNNEVLANHIYHNVLRNWPRGRYKWGNWSAGAGTSTSDNKFIGNIVHQNGGEGLLATGGAHGAIFQDNIVFDNWSVNIYVDNHSDSIIERNLIFCHEPDVNQLYNNGDTDPRDGKNLRRLRAEGIMTADEKYGLNPPANLRNIKIVNNIIIGCRRGITHYAQAQGSGLKDVLVANNTIVVPNSLGANEEYIGINIPYNGGNNNNTTYVNNIVYASHPKTHLLVVETPLLKDDEFPGIKFSHNIWFHKNSVKPFHVGSKWLSVYDSDFTKWQKLCSAKGQCTGEIYADPRLMNVGTYSADDGMLRNDSPAINAGIPFKEVTVDLQHNTRSTTSPSIGAIEDVRSKIGRTE